MKRIRYAVGVLVALGAASFPFLALTNSGGAPPGFSGPEQNCQVCHNSFDLNSGTGGVAIEAPATFVPGAVIPLTVTVTNTTTPLPVVRQGFEASVRDAADLQVFLDSFEVDDVTVRRTSGNERFVTHTAAGNTATSWTFNWVAPAGGAPDSVRIYAAGNAANGNSGLSGDYVYTTSVTIVRASVSAEPPPEPFALVLSPVAPNPVRESARAAYTLGRSAAVAVRLLDGQGRTVRLIESGPRAAGAHALALDASGLAAGAYFLAVETAQGRRVQPLTVVR